MENKQTSSKLAIKIIVFLILAFIFQAIFSSNVADIFITALFFISVIFTGIYAGLGLGILFPLVALIGGMLAPLNNVLWGLIIGNTLLVVVFWLFKKIAINNAKSLYLWIGALLGAILRVIPITISANRITDISQDIRNALGFPQLATALVGGFLALIIYHLLRAYKSEILPENISDKNTSV